MIVLGLRDMFRHRSEAATINRYLHFFFVTLTLLAWSIWLLFRAAPLLEP